MNMLNDFLQNNPKIRERYVVMGTVLVDTLVLPLEKFMAHLLEVQGIDPKKAQTNQVLKDALSAAIDQVDDSEEFDSDFDVDWVLKHYAKAKTRLDNLTRDSYRKMTDLTHVSDQEAQSLVADKKENNWDFLSEKIVNENPVYTVKDQENIQKLANQPEILSLGKFREVLSKYADSLKENKENKETVNVARQPSIIGKGRKSKKKSSAKMYNEVRSESKVARHRVTKTFKNGNFRRIEDK